MAWNRYPRQALQQTDSSLVIASNFTTYISCKITAETESVVNKRFGSLGVRYGMAYFQAPPDNVSTHPSTRFLALTAELTTSESIHGHLFDADRDEAETKCSETYISLFDHIKSSGRPGRSRSWLA